LQAVDDRGDGSFGRALEIGVLDAHDELAAVMPRIGPREERGACASYMEIAGGAWRETGPDSHLVGAAFDGEALRAPAQHAAREVGDALEAGLAKEHRGLR